ncbi:MAG: excinuclease ABC subunit UvrB [Desulfobacteraceae bacterium]|nr:excinuclease ABC subunit UvrB [Desulfobacteraceae bacterium]
MEKFKLVSGYAPKGDQPAAIKKLCKGIQGALQDQVLLGVTGSGKTFTMAHVVAELNRPALVIAPNKTLAAQLFQEFKQLFPENAVEYFVSYYDYYQPEAYVPATDTYIQKDSSINELIDKMRHSATRSVLSRRDVLVVASVSCIFGLGAPEDYLAMRCHLETGSQMSREQLLRQLVLMQYERNDVDFHRGAFRVRGDRVEIFPAYEEDMAVRVDFFGDEIDGLNQIDPLRGIVLKSITGATIFPASHYVTTRQTLKRAFDSIMKEMIERAGWFTSQQKFIEAQRIEERTRFDLEMIHELGYCTGIENYSRHLTGRRAGQPSPTLLDYFPEDYIMFIDESHIGVPQLRAMYKGDRSRKQTLTQYGFRLPSALDNRPLKFQEWRKRARQVIYVSATPANYELEQSGDAVVEQIVRPTGLIDPQIIIHSASNQVDDLYDEIKRCLKKEGRVLVTTLTKRMAEDLCEYYTDLNLAVRYLHSDVSTLERMDIIRDLRVGKFDVLIGINLLREGLDIPEVMLVAILDADKEGFLRSARSLIQTFGRAARNVNGKVILYADQTTASMAQAIEETQRRRDVQQTFNQIHGIVPQSITKSITGVFDAVYETQEPVFQEAAEAEPEYASTDTIEAAIKELEKQMKVAAKELAFERAAVLRDRIKVLQRRLMYEQ